MIKLWIFILAILAVFISTAYFIMTNNYPVAFVGSSMIAVKDFNKDYNGAINYYKNAAELYNKKDESIMGAKEVKLEIQRAVLDNLIENLIIEKELNKRVKEGDLTRMVEQKISQSLGDKDMSKAIEKIYGFSAKEFKERALIPQARLEILQGQFYLENKNYDQWLKEEKLREKVVVLISGFSWDGEHVILKK